MIAQTLQDACSPQGRKTPLTNPTPALRRWRHSLPWHPMMDRLVPCSHSPKGCTGHALRLLGAASRLSRRRHLRDRKGSEHMQDHRSLPSLCQVPEQRRLTCLHPSTLGRCRQRLGQEGPLSLADQVFEPLTRAAVLDADLRLLDATGLASPRLSPTDVRLLSTACGTRAGVASEGPLAPWGAPPHGHQRGRADHRPPQARLASLRAFAPGLVPA
jgi:hypothetical protein